MLFCSSVVFAETANDDAQIPEAPWYELSAEDTVLTVSLPGNNEDGMNWDFEISNPAALELVTMETIAAEEDGMADAPTTFVASFIAVGNQAENVTLILRYAASEDEAAVYTRVLQLSVSAENLITVSSVQEINPSTDWIELDDDSCVLTVRMPSAEWSFIKVLLVLRLFAISAVR